MTSKLWVHDVSYEGAKAGYQRSLDKLGLEYLDLFLIHQPYNDLFGAWRAMEELHGDGKVRAIGVSNLTSDRLFSNPLLQDIANRHGKSVAQVVLRWNVQREAVVIPKSTHKERIAQNFDVFDFALTDEDMAAIAHPRRGQGPLRGARGPGLRQGLARSSAPGLTARRWYGGSRREVPQRPCIGWFIQLRGTPTGV